MDQKIQAQLANLNQLYQDQTNESEMPPKTSLISEGLWLTVWSRLQDAKVIFEASNSSTSFYWLDQMEKGGFSEEELMRGCEGADNYTDKRTFGLGIFKSLCRPKNIFSQSHKLLLPNENTYVAAEHQPVRKKIHALAEECHSLSRTYRNPNNL